MSNWILVFSLILSYLVSIEIIVSPPLPLTNYAWKYHLSFHQISHKEFSIFFSLSSLKLFSSFDKGFSLILFSQFFTWKNRLTVWNYKNSWSVTRSHSLLLLLCVYQKMFIRSFTVIILHAFVCYISTIQLIDL